MGCFQLVHILFMMKLHLHYKFVSRLFYALLIVWQEKEKRKMLNVWKKHLRVLAQCFMY